MSTKIKATYYYPGSFVSETDSREIAAPTLEAALAARPNDGWFAVEVTATPVKTFRAEDGEERVLPDGKPVKVAKWYIGQAFTAEQVRALGPDHQILLSNMRGNGWSTVVKTRRGNWQPVEDKDYVLSAYPESS